jgi:hypothetical protein
VNVKKVPRREAFGSWNSRGNPEARPGGDLISSESLNYASEYADSLCPTGP